MRRRGAATRRVGVLALTAALATLATHPAPSAAATVNCTITGTDAAERLRGTAARDVICARGGADRILGRGGADLIYGGRGSDRIAAGFGNDVAYGNRRGDRVLGGAGNDRVYGGLGTDLCRGGRGNDLRRGCELPNRAPAATDDAAATDERSPLILRVLSNDSDPDREPLAIRSLDAGATTGLVRVTGDRRAVAYEPAGRFTGLGAGEAATDRFSYTVADRRGATDRGAVSITVVGIDDPPVAAADVATLREDDGATPIDVLPNDADPDGGPKSISSAADGDHGQVQIADGGGGLTYTPEPDYCGADSFTYRLSPGGSETRVSLSIACSDDADDISVGTTPQLTPAFDRGISDYVVRCGADPVVVSVQAKPGASVGVDGAAPQGGQFSRTVALSSGQGFLLTTLNAGVERTYRVRCLPPDFPAWNFQRLAQPQQEWYLVTPGLGRGLDASARYAVFFDQYGVPVWWYEARSVPVDAKVLSDGTLAWALFNGSHADGYDLHRLDGGLIRTVRTVGTPTDHHDLQEAGDGNLLLMSYKRRDHVDLSAYGGSSDASVIDAELQEIDPDGTVLWTWNSSDHIGLDETGRWWQIGVGSPADIVHINSAEIAGDSIIISLRHTDAVYKIDRTTGEVQWKLGGTATDDSLTVLGDPHGSYPLGGQHDARILADGSLTIHDNGTGLGRPPRAVRYEIDEVAGTATLVESVSDPLVPISSCCGSARRSASGSWLMAWGGNTRVTEFDSAGARTFSLTFPDNRFTYRAFPVPPGRISRDMMWDAMEAMHPR